MDELARLKLRRRRRQEAFQALDEVDDRLKSLAGTLHQIEALAVDLKVRRFLVFASPAPERAPLLALCDGATPLLEDIGERVQSLRNEFQALKHSDDRERLELEALLTNPTTR